MMVTGMNRRSFLGHLGITAGVAATTGAVAADHVFRQEENPDLLLLDAELGEKVSVFEAAGIEKAAARRRFDQVKPAVPDDLLVSYPDAFARDFAEPEYDVEGKRQRRTIVRSWHLDRAGRSTDGRTLRGRRIRKLLLIAQAYEQAHEDAIQASGFDAADRAYNVAARDLVKLADQACTIKAMTMQGVTIQSKVFLAALATGHEAMFNPTRWGPQIANSVVTVAGRAA